MDVSTFNSALKTAVANGLQLVDSANPVAGMILSTLVGVLWPDSNNAAQVWGEIRADVEELVDQALDTNVYNNVEVLLNGGKKATDPEGLHGVITTYTQSLTSADVETIKINWGAVNDIFTTNVGLFKQPGYEVLLLPLFAQMANLRIALLQDAVLHGVSWNWTPEYVETIRQTLKQVIADHTTWVTTWFQKGLKDVASSNADSAPIVLWAAQNNFARGMVLQAADFAYYWPYFDPDALPAPANPREIYSDPAGTAVFADKGDIPENWILDVTTQPSVTLPITTPTLKTNYDPSVTTDPLYRKMAAVSISWNTPVSPAITNIAVWTARLTGFVCAATVTSGSQFSGIMGVQNASWPGLVIESMPITTVRGAADDVLEWMQFVSKNDPTAYSPVFGNILGLSSIPGGNPFQTGPRPYLWGFDAHQLSSLTVTGVCTCQGESIAACAIFGFRYANSY